MLFNSYVFVFLFLPISWAAFWLLARRGLKQAALAVLTLSSLAFYAYWSISSLPLILASILFNYGIGEAIARSRMQAKRARVYLVLGVGANLAILGYFKYLGFFMGTANHLLHRTWPVQSIMLPLGISFFTFTQIAFLVDAYQARTEGHGFLKYGLFVTFFPHLIAGPILHHANIIPQFEDERTFEWSPKNISTGLMLFTMGLVKKVLIADQLAPTANQIFAAAGSATFADAWVGALAYTYQLYFDFSGYSDMAVGLGLLFNIQLPFNFNSPYKSQSIIDFWRRWHISLSNFLRDYLYIPLGGNRLGEARRLTNLLATMFLGGLWHGASWTFVVWGTLHGSYLVINHGWKKWARPLPGFIGWSATFAAVVVAWVFFRAQSVGDAGRMLGTMAGLHGLQAPTLQTPILWWLAPLALGPAALHGWSVGALNALVLMTITLWVTATPNSQEVVARLKLRPSVGVAFGLAAIAALASMNEVSEFLYFQF
jgi:alginate O-acetyltransferase complex protein AlgI